MEQDKPGIPGESHLRPGGNIWGPKFPLFGLIVILLFSALIGIRACMLGVPLRNVFRNTDHAPEAVDSIPTNE